MSNTVGRGRGPMGRRRGMSGEKAKDFKDAMLRLLKYMERYKFRLILMVIFAIGGTVFNIIGPKILGKATTELYSGLISKINGGSGIDFDKIIKILFSANLLFGRGGFNRITAFVGHAGHAAAVDAGGIALLRAVEDPEHRQKRRGDNHNRQHHQQGNAQRASASETALHIARMSDRGFIILHHGYFSPVASADRCAPEWYRR